MNLTLNNSQICLLLENNKSPKNIVSKLRNKGDGKMTRIVDKLGYEYSFVFIFGPTIKAVYPIVLSLVNNMKLPEEISKETIVYLTISLVGILLNRPKKEYQDILTKVKEGGLYDTLPKLIKSMKGIKTIFSYISKKLGKFVGNFVEMFAYTSLLVPFAITFEDIVNKENVNINEILKSFSENGFNKVIVTSLGIGIFSAKEFVADMVNGLKSFKSKGIDKVKKVISKIKEIKFKEIFKNIDYDNSSDYGNSNDYGDIEFDSIKNPVDKLFYESNNNRLMSYSQFIYTK